MLYEIARETPGVRLEHTMDDGNEPEQLPWKDRERKILSVERWLQIVENDERNAPTPEAIRTITGPYYRWHRDDLGRALVTANHHGAEVFMFMELWSGDPEA